MWKASDSAIPVGGEDHKQRHEPGVVGHGCEFQRDRMTTRLHRPTITPQPSWPAPLRRAADQDRTGIISLEGASGHQLEPVRAQTSLVGNTGECRQSALLTTSSRSFVVSLWSESGRDLADPASVADDRWIVR
jgi:hypothetical protein